MFKRVNSSKSGSIDFNSKKYSLNSANEGLVVHYRKLSQATLASRITTSCPAQPGKDALDPDTAVMWWAGKEFKREKRMFEHVGKNEKTKVRLSIESYPLPARCSFFR